MRINLKAVIVCVIAICCVFGTMYALTSPAQTAQAQHVYKPGDRYSIQLGSSKIEGTIADQATADILNGVQHEQSLEPQTVNRSHKESRLTTPAQTAQSEPAPHKESLYARDVWSNVVYVRHEADWSGKPEHCSSINYSCKAF